MLQKESDGQREQELEETCKRQEAKIEELTEQLRDHDTGRHDFKLQLNEALEKIIRLEEEIFMSRSTQKEILDQLKQNEDEMEEMMDTDNELRQENGLLKDELSRLKHKVYIGAKDDSIDRVLANYLNEHAAGDKIKILFIRQSEGVYLFGSRRVLIKVELSDKLLVRVGSGFLPIDSFIEQYQQAELDKIHRKNALQNFQAQTTSSSASHQSSYIVDSSFAGLSRDASPAPKLPQKRYSRLNKPRAHIASPKKGEAAEQRRRPQDHHRASKLH